MREIARLAHVGVDEGGESKGAPTDPALRPAVLCVQELTPSLKALLETELDARSSGYRKLFHQPWAQCGSNGEERYGVGITTRPPLGPLIAPKFHGFNGSHMGRGLVYGVADWLPSAPIFSGASGSTVPGQDHNAPRVILGTTHLESFMGPDNQWFILPQRKEQLREAGRLLAAELERTPRGACAFLMGDMNWKDDEDGNPLETLGYGWRDAFVDAGSPKGKMATCYSWRFDRCFYLPAAAAKGQQRSLHAAALALLGKKPGPFLEGKDYTKSNGATAKCPPSDHKGPLFTFVAGDRGVGGSTPFEKAKMGMP